MGISLLVLSLAALLVSFVPFLNWIALVIAAPLALVGSLLIALRARQHGAQPADRALIWVALSVAMFVTLRLWTLA